MTTEWAIWKDEAAPLVYRIQGILNKKISLGYHASGVLFNLAAKWKDVSVLVGRLKQLEEELANKDGWTYEEVMPMIRDRISWAGYLLEKEHEQA